MSQMSGLERAKNTRASTGGDNLPRSRIVLATICLGLAMILSPTPASAVAPNTETITCQPGQTENSNLGTCQDPTCGPGTQRDPSGNTRYCLPISCPAGETYDANANACLSPPPPPPPKCPNGATGQYEKLSTGVTVIVCPKTLPNHPPPVTTTRPPNAGVGH